MILDEIDLKILKAFLELGEEEKETSSWKIMKKVYPRGRDTEHMRVIKKMERMAKNGLILIVGKPKSYNLFEDKVLLNKIPTIKNCISLNINGKWEIFEI